MQKLLVELKNTPWNASQVPRPVNFGLNREETLSDQDIVLANNNSDVNHRQHMDSQNLRVSDIVYVLNLKGQPLMPTKQRKARWLLKQNRAKVVKKFPFTIQLLRPSGENKQDITCGIDLGYSMIGFSCTTKSKELICGELKLDSMTSNRLMERKMYRCGRRSKLWYRKARFLNRISNKKERWLPPSINRKYFTHLNLIKRLFNTLPVKQVIIEIGNFDIQKIENPNIKRKEYQQGTMYSYRNKITYLLAREKRKCQFCNQGYQKGNPWRLHHIWGKLKDRPEDWALLHKKCHNELHQKKMEKVLQKKKSKSYRGSTFMNIIKRRFKQDLNCTFVFGYETFIKRNKLCLLKTHETDAFIISGGTIQLRTTPFQINQKHKNNRVIQLNRKGFKPSIRRQRYKIQPNDLFWVDGIRYVCKGMFNYGKYILYGLAKKKEYFKIEQIQKYFNINSWQFIS